MWQTSEGNRTLAGDEATFICNAIDSLIDRLLERFSIPDQMQDPDGWQWDFKVGISQFDALTPHQQISLLHCVAKHLLEPTPEVLPLTSENEAAVAAIYMHAMNEIESEIFLSHDMTKEVSALDANPWQQNDWGDDDAADLPAEQTCDYAGDDLFEWRQLATNAYRDTSNLEVDLEPLPLTESERKTAEACLGYDGTEEDTTDIAPKLNSTDMSDWRYLIEILSDRVLWDRDFETTETMLDLDPTQAAITKAAMGIEDGYSISLVPDPPFDEIPRLVTETRKIVRKKPR